MALASESLEATACSDRYQMQLIVIYKQITVTVKGYAVETEYNKEKEKGNL
jgi:hypothetical protein